jgi:hypothetical protein
MIFDSNNDIICSNISDESVCNNTNFNNELDIWHVRMGHPPISRYNALKEYYPYVHFNKNVPVCDACHYGKQKRIPYNVSESIAEKPFDLIHMDIWGPLSSPSISGHKYFLTVVDDRTRHIWVFFMKLKSETRNLVKSFVNLVENQFDKKVKAIRTDNGQEFILTEFYSSKGIEHQRSCVECPQQNGRVERRHQHILNITRTIMIQSKIPKIFWCFDVAHAVFLINRMPSPLLNNMSPHHLMFGKIANISHIKSFGLLVFCIYINCQQKKT